MADHNDLGAKGEALAAAYLRDKGYTIIARNYRYQKAEIDILAGKAGLLVIVEVKARSSEDFEPIAGTVGRKKVRHLVTAADHYVTQQNITHEVRFDIVTVYFQGKTPQIKHIEDAFYHF
jgi:putative endonuclease